MFRFNDVGAEAPNENTSDLVSEDGIHPCRCPACVARLNKRQWMALPHVHFEIVVAAQNVAAIARESEVFDLIEHLTYTLPEDRPDLVRFLWGRWSGDTFKETMITFPAGAEEFQTILDQQFVPALNALGWTVTMSVSQSPGLAGGRTATWKNAFL
jgi:hypothetical protein